MASSVDHDELFKVIIIGDSGTGKTSLMDRFTENIFNPTYNFTLGLDFKTKRLIVDGVQVKLQVWDTAGQERFRTICVPYYRGCHGVIIAYDVTDSQSFAHVKQWLEDIDRYCAETVRECIILAGNKEDGAKEKAVSTEEAESFAKQLKMPLYETSAATGKNVEAMFEQLTRLCIATRTRSNGDEATSKQRAPGQPIQLNLKNKRNQNCC